MAKFTIKGSFVDTINRIEFCNKIKISQTKEISFYYKTNKSELIKAIKNGKSFYILEDIIYIEVDRTEEEKEKDIEHYKNVVKYNISTLKNWFNQKEDYKNQIETYLELKKLNWILKEIK